MKRDCKTSESARLVSSRTAKTPQQGIAKKRKRSERRRKVRSGHEASPSMLSPIFSKVPLSTNQIITPTTPATMARKNIQKHQQTTVRFFFLLFWRASHESLRLYMFS